MRRSRLSGRDDVGLKAPIRVGPWLENVDKVSSCSARRLACPLGTSKVIRLTSALTSAAAELFARY